MSRKRIEKNLAYDDGKRLFYVYFAYGRDAFGRRMRKTKTFSQKEMAKEALCRFEIRRLQNRLTPPTQMTLEHWLPTDTRSQLGADIFIHWPNLKGFNVCEEIYAGVL